MDESLARNSSTPHRIDLSSPVLAETHLLAGEEVHATVGGQLNTWVTNKERSTGLESGAKAKSTSQVPSGTEIAKMAMVDRLESTLGGYLFKGMNESRMRHLEKEKKMVSFTDTVRLHFAYYQGGDFKLEVWICSSFGKAILQAKKMSYSAVRDMLGDYLFGAMEAIRRI